MTGAAVYHVAGVHCSHCRSAIESEVEAVAGVERVEVDLDAKIVTVSGRAFDDVAVRTAIAEAGYEVDG
jgi:copper chaperone CopZ